MALRTQSETTAIIGLISGFRGCGRAPDHGLGYGAWVRRCPHTHYTRPQVSRNGAGLPGICQNRQKRPGFSLLSGVFVCCALFLAVRSRALRSLLLEDLEERSRCPAVGAHSGHPGQQ